MAASWIVQVGVDIYRTLCRLFKSKEELDEPAKRAEFEILGRKVFGATVRCSASLIFAAIGAGIGATLLRPSLGQWVGKRTCKQNQKDGKKFSKGGKKKTAQ